MLCLDFFLRSLHYLVQRLIGQDDVLIVITYNARRYSAPSNESSRCSHEGLGACVRDRLEVNATHCAAKRYACDFFSANSSDKLTEVAESSVCERRCGRYFFGRQWSHAWYIVRSPVVFKAFSALSHYSFHS